MVHGAEFQITCKRLKLRRKAGRLQLIQNLAQSTILWRQCDIRIAFSCFSRKYFQQFCRDVATGKIYAQLRQCLAESAPTCWNRFRVSEKLGESAVVPVAPVDTSLVLICIELTLRQITNL